ncbi:hypothetical protein V1525DRAFT_414422 [Lipomyces kononenkoae]|uniref:Uncharacterized protein n=1 Tax=Lipomyces kononenkoae TaxID=34357 RepID=A0ACC3SQW8_LIPKO
MHFIQVMHFILEVQDSGNGTQHRLSTYKRIVVQISNKQLRGNNGKPVESIAEVQW